MRRGHPSGRSRNDVEGGPQGLNDFPFNPSGPLDESWGVPGEAFRSVAMDMPNPNSGNQANVFGNVQIGTGLNSPTEVLHVLAIDIIEGQDLSDALGIVLDGMDEGVIHVDLSGMNGSVSPRHDPESQYLSPFWKSTTECGKKHPCRAQADPCYERTYFI